MIVNGEVTMVTGGASGIGLALSTRFGKEGAQVVLSDLDQEACNRHAAPAGALPVAADVGREEDIKNLVVATFAHFGRSISLSRTPGIAIDGGIDTPTDKVQKIIGVNLLSQVFTAKHAIPACSSKAAAICSTSRPRLASSSSSTPFPTR